MASIVDPSRQEITHEISAAARLKISRAYLYRLIAAGEIAAYRSGRRRFTSEPAVQAFVTGRETVGARRK